MEASSRPTSSERDEHASQLLDDVLKLRQTIAVHKAALKKMRDVRPRRSVSLDDVATSPPPVGAEDPLFFCCTDEPMDDFDGDDDIGRLPGPSGEELPLPSWTLTPVDESSPPRPFGKRSCRDARRSSRIVRRPRLVRCDGAFDAGRRLAKMTPGSSPRQQSLLFFFARSSTPAQVQFDYEESDDQELRIVYAQALRPVEFEATANERDVAVEVVAALDDDADEASRPYVVELERAAVTPTASGQPLDVRGHVRDIEFSRELRVNLETIRARAAPTRDVEIEQQYRDVEVEQQYRDVEVEQQYRDVEVEHAPERQVELEYSVGERHVELEYLPPTEFYENGHGPRTRVAVSDLAPGAGPY